MGRRLVCVHVTLPCSSVVVRSPTVMTPAEMISLRSFSLKSAPRLCLSSMSWSRELASAVPPKAMFWSSCACICTRLDSHPSSCMECMVALWFYVGGQPL